MSQDRSMNSVIISVNDIEEPPWLPSFTSFCEHVLTLRQKENWEVSVVLCDDAMIHQLNRVYRDKDQPTDVLSFCQNEGEKIPGEDTRGVISAGDIVISLDTIQQNAQHCAISMKEELARVFIHGLLHLEGYNHATNDAGDPMLVMQEQLLKQARADTEFI